MVACRPFVVNCANERAVRAPQIATLAAQLLGKSEEEAAALKSHEARTWFLF